jgi:SAM-dependent methyltransferase
MGGNPLKEMFAQAEELAHRGSVAEAEVLYRALLARGSDLSAEMHADVLNDLAAVSLSRGAVEEARACLRQATALAPFHRQAQINLFELEEMDGTRLSTRDLRDYLMRFYGEDEHARSYISVHLRRFAEMLAVVGRGNPRLKLLELGANTYFSLLLRKFAEYETVHTDYWEGEAEKTIRLKTLDGRDEVEMKLHNFNAEKDRYPFADETFDFAVAAEIIEHLPNDPMFMMHELDRVLKTGATLFLTTPNVTSLRSVGAILHGYPPYVYNKFSSRNGGRHCKEYAPREIRLLLERSGFTVLKLETRDVWVESEPETSYWGLYQRMHDVLKDIGASVALRGEDIFAVGRKSSAPLERYPVELYD